MRLDHALRNTALRLRRRQIATSFLDAEVLLSFVLKQSREWISAHPETQLTRTQASKFQKYISRRHLHVPIAYLIHRKEFYGLPFTVNRATLIPRPESETIIDVILNQYRPKEPLTIADIGTGCGALAVTVATYLPNATVWAVDRSQTALRVARANAKKHGVDVRFLHGDLLQPLARLRLDAIVANLPYLPTTTRHTASGSLVFEPASALWSGPDGLSHYRRLFQQLGKRKQLPALIVCEAESNQIPKIKSTLASQLPRYQMSSLVVSGIATLVLKKEGRKSARISTCSRTRRRTEGTR